LIVGKVHEVERNTLIEMRKRNEITAQVRRALERELDLLDVRFAQSG
jgi:hypothetical protein